MTGAPAVGVVAWAHRDATILEIAGPLYKDGMPATERLYHDDPFLLRFSARVIAHGTFDKRPSVILDRTAFYPEAGGQMADRGKFTPFGLLPDDGVASSPEVTLVTDVQVGDDGQIHHMLSGALPEVGHVIEGAVDRERRRSHMALHTGQHMLSRALLDVANAATVSSRLGETMCTIDVDQEVVEERRIAEAEDLVASLVDSDVPVRAFFPTESELAALPLRRAPTVTENVRVVSIGDFDVSPCGGTHCTSSAQVGLVHVTGVERYKGKQRVLFTAGPRGRRELVTHAVTLRALGRELSCDGLLVPQGVAKLREELGAVRDALGKMRGRYAEALATGLAALAKTDGTPMVAVIEEGAVELLRSIATRLTSHTNAVVVVLGGRVAEGMNVLVARSATSTFDCGAFLKRLATAAGGRGGGRKEHAEGKLPRDMDLESVARTVLAGEPK